MISFFYVAGPYGSGTTAIAGALALAGVNSLPPHFTTNDNRTPNSYEAIKFREIVKRYVNESKFYYDFQIEAELIQELGFLKNQIITLQANQLKKGKDAPQTSTFFKMPISALCIEPIIKVFDPTIVLIRRSFDEIEASRIRRRWPATYGSEGARIIYSAINVALTKMKRNFIEIEYQQLVVRPAYELERVFEYAGVDKELYDIDAGANFIRSPDQSMELNNS